jgi:dethiobiotin synthetase
LPRSRERAAHAFFALSSSIEEKTTVKSREACFSGAVSRTTVKVSTRRQMVAGRKPIAPMRERTFFITGTDTGVGKTVLTALLARHLRHRGNAVAALKPICSGGRDDARILQTASGGDLTLDEINPWHFRAPLAPFLAARREKRRVTLAQVVDHVRAVQRRFDVLLVEGAGGLLSPLGEDFNSRDLIAAWRATPIIACSNRLGAVNQALLTIEALPRTAARRARLVLVDPPEQDSASRANRELLTELLGGSQVSVLPWLPQSDRSLLLPAGTQVRRVLEVILTAVNF